MKVRLVAYRKATTTATKDSAYHLDLQEAPNIAINYQFSDIKEPDVRKSSYSQTFKLPFTPNNNKFFQDWYNVNLETLVFNTRQKFEAILYVGTVPQFEGALQLKAVYQKAQVYEVVLLSNTASLFNIIGEKRLKEVFLEDDNTYSEDYNHTFTYTNSTDNTLYKSWDGSSSAFVNAAGTSLKDPDADVQKIVYPMSVTRQGFYYDEAEVNSAGSAVKRNLRMDQTAATNLLNATGIDTAWGSAVPIGQFRPAMQIKEIFKLILARAGFSYTSAFIDGTGDYASQKYFSKIYMTLGNHLETLGLPVASGFNPLSGIFHVGTKAPTSYYGPTTDIQITLAQALYLDLAVYGYNYSPPAAGCTTPVDTDGIWSGGYNHYMTKQTENQTEVTIRHIPAWQNLGWEMFNGGAYAPSIRCRAYIVNADGTTNWDLELDSSSQSLFGSNLNEADEISILLEHTLDISGANVGDNIRFIFKWSTVTQGTAGTSTYVNFGKYTSKDGVEVMCGNEAYTSIRCEWNPIDAALLDSTIDIPACFDHNITQRDFLRDIIQRFNLVVLTDPSDDSNLIIEPYNDFVASGNIKDWSNKLDLSKETIVKDTISLQKSRVEFTDSEDVDLYNKSMKERYPEINVYGKFIVEYFNNEFATGEMKTQGIFSPYINAKVFVNHDEQLETQLINMTVQYEFSYEQVAEGVYENVIKQTKPKLFWYCGVPTEVLDNTSSNATYYLHSSPDISTITAHSFTKYPVCSPFDIVPTADSTYQLDANTKTLYWNSTPPLNSGIAIFNYGGDVGSWFNNSLYGLYWKSYLDNIYSDDARIMEAYLNLDEGDIFDFSFTDEIFIKDAYWRILTISNYQVGTKSSTKVTFIKILDTVANCKDCNYVIGIIPGSNTNTIGQTFLWCPDNDPDCLPSSGPISTYQPYTWTNLECCICNGGNPTFNNATPIGVDDDLMQCLVNANSLPISLKGQYSAVALIHSARQKTIITGKLGGLSQPFVRGSDTGRFSESLGFNHSDDIVIKYKNKFRDTPAIKGESHRIALIGNTDGNTRAYATPEGNVNAQAFSFQDNYNMVIRVKGVATVIGGTSSTYRVGTTEAFAYYTAFKSMDGTITQLSTAGGDLEFSIREGANPTTCTLYIDTNNGILRFGLDDSQTDTKRLWTLTADIDVNNINSIGLAYGENWALWQDFNRIQLQNFDYLIWN